VFEAKNLLTRPDNVECTMIGKLDTHIAQELQTYNKTVHNPIHLKPLKYSLVIHTYKGTLEILKLNLPYLLSNPGLLP